MDLRNTDLSSRFEPELLAEMERVGTFKEVAEGEDIIKAGQYIRSIPLLLQGSIKILRPDDHGEELLLYYLEQGDTCAVSLSCCLGNTKSEIHAVAEAASTLLLIPVSKMEEWSGKYKTWRNFVMNSYHARMMEMLDSIDMIAFNNMDNRLENYLHEKVKVNNSKHLYTTHREIANDLHSSRVVISRLLKKMEHDHKITLHRNFIELL